MQFETGVSIIKVLTYFDIFDYPVSGDEIAFFLERPADSDALLETLQELVEEKYIFLIQDFYSLHNDVALVTRRLTGNRRAQSLLQIAHRISRFLFQFPFVRGIGISGSLSKNFAGENADIDYFIITKANRLWIARTLMHAFKKLSFLTGRQHWYCMNYYVDEAMLEIREKNIYTAIEVITLFPVQGDGVFDAFFRENKWVNAYYPNWNQAKRREKTNDYHSGLKRIMEWIMDNRLGGWLDDYFMRVTTRRWKKKEDEKRVSISGARMGLHTDKHFSKPNPAFLQRDILTSYNNRLSRLEEKWEKSYL